LRELTKNERFDIQTMRYFIPKTTKKGWRITAKDRVAMADWSGRGIKPDEPITIGMSDQIPTGLQVLAIGKTFRDYHIKDWGESIELGYITKAELLDGVPEWMRGWLYKKIKHIPYDVNGDASGLWISEYSKLKGQS